MDVVLQCTAIALLPPPAHGLTLTATPGHPRPAAGHILNSPFSGSLVPAAPCEESMRGVPPDRPLPPHVLLRWNDQDNHDRQAALDLHL
ncbi:hypothetical protein ACIPRU_02760 [Streptomyces sp. NPDC090126]|uniref:hypothetical protein n=1 Tax=Streptomyces sp. NPDC090126 TaxID=3365952 RepID=UPI00382AD91A